MAKNIDEVWKELRALRDELRAPRRRLLPIPEAAEYLGIAARTIRNDLARGKFPVRPVKYGAKILFRIEDLQAYVDAMEGAE